MMARIDHARRGYQAFLTIALWLLIGSPAASLARCVELTLEDAQRGTVRVTLLRPLEWFQATGLRVGSEFALDLPEMGISGTASVVSVGPCPEVGASLPGGRIVTGTFVTERAEILRVWLEGALEPIGATPSHRFYADDRSAWVRAGELQPGDMVRTLSGSERVQRIEPVPSPTPVYNIEVHRDHTYYVGEHSVWVHNQYVARPTVIIRPKGASGGGRGAGFMAPDGKVFVGTLHAPIQQWLYRQGLWKSAGSPGVRGWIYGYMRADRDVCRYPNTSAVACLGWLERTHDRRSALPITSRAGPLAVRS